MATGAYETDVTYSPLVDSVRAIYDKDLPDWAKPYVILDTDELKSILTSPTPVVDTCQLSLKVLLAVKAPGDPIPGCVWNPDYVWPLLPAPVTVPELVDSKESDAWVVAVGSVVDKLTPAMVKHLKTADPTDQAVVAAEDLVVAVLERLM